MERNSFGQQQPHEFNNYRNQFYAVISANLLVFSQGCASGWITPALMLLTSPNAPLETGPLTLDELSWMGSINRIGGILGTFTIGYLASVVGCKRALTFLGIPAFAFWLIILTADSANWLICARFLTGWTSGGTYSIIMLYVAEIADPKIRGSLGSISNICRNVGLFVAYVMGAVLSYSQMTYTLMIIPIVYVINFILLPNTPMFWLAKDGNIEKAGASLMFYKGCKDPSASETIALMAEMDRMKSQADQTESNGNLSLRDVFERRAVRGIYIIGVFSCLREFTGAVIFVVYAGKILSETGTILNPHVCAIIFGIVNIVGSCCTMRLADRIGRKVLLIISLSGCVVGQSVLAIYTHLLKCKYFDLSHFTWVPVISVSFVIFVATFADIMSVCTVEVVPPKIRPVSTTVELIVMNFTAFSLGKFFPIACETYGISKVLVVMSTLCVVGIAFVVFVVEETRGRNLDSISVENNRTETTDRAENGGIRTRTKYGSVSST